MFAGTKRPMSENEFLEVFMNTTVLTKSYFYIKADILIT
jgi:hypothetical protein